MKQNCSVLLLCLLLSGCSTPDGPPTFKIVPAKATDQVTSNLSGDEVRFDIHSKTGIGKAKIKLTGGQWPETILLRLHKSGMENLRLSYSETVVEVSVSSTQGHNVIRSVTQTGQNAEPVEEDSAFSMPVKTGEDGKWFEAQVPADFFNRKPNEFQIAWIDFYR